MMCIISPAKKLNFKTIALKDKTEVRFRSEMAELIKVLKTKKSSDLMKLMDISKALGDLNAQRYKNFDTTMPENQCKQALFAFNGDVYQGLKADDFDPGDVKFSQDHLRILSGLYGLLRPLDMIQEYRLEMGCGLQTPKAKDLYHYWGDKISILLKEDMKKAKDKILVNLASEEYFSVIHTDQFKGNLIHIRFEEKRQGNYQVISFSAKKARGFMARYIIKNRLTDVKDLKNFSEEKYSYMPSRSTEDQYTFVR